MYRFFFSIGIDCNTEEEKEILKLKLKEIVKSKGFVSVASYIRQYIISEYEKIKK